MAEEKIVGFDVTFVVRNVSLKDLGGKIAEIVERFGALPSDLHAITDIIEPPKNLSVRSKAVAALPPPPESRTALELILDFLSSGPKSRAEISDIIVAAGKHRTSAYGAIAAGEKQGKIRKVKHGVYALAPQAKGESKS